MYNNMKELVFMRHGRALSPAESGTNSDSQRKLAQDAAGPIKVSALKLKTSGFSPSVIISSPLRRAVETADIAATVFPEARRLQEPALASALSAGAIFDALGKAARQDQAVLVIGHQPTLSELTYTLTDKLCAPFTTAGFAFLKLKSELKPGTAELADFFSPEHF